MSKETAYRSRSIKTRAFKPEPINIDSFPVASRTDFFIRLYEDATGQTVDVPFIVIRGGEPGPVVGISAAVHGNELNGIRIIHHLIADLDLKRMRGALLCAPIVNVPSFNLGQREFIDGLDLNHIFPGKSKGKSAEQYARRFLQVFLPACDYLVDIHTASEGRINTFYVRADMNLPTSRRMAELCGPQIILHSRSGDGTLRNAARTRKIPAITVEAGNPGIFQGKRIYEGEAGVRNILVDLKVIEGEIVMHHAPVLCRSSKWLRTVSGGLLETEFKLYDRVEKGQLLTRTYDPFGYVAEKYKAPNSGIVIGMAQNPVAIPGTRYCHLGEIGEPGPPKASADKR